MRDWQDRAEQWAREICAASEGPEGRELIFGPSLPGEWGGQGSMASYLAATHALLSRRGNADAHLSAAREYLLLPTPTHTFATSALWTAMHELRKAGMVSAEDEERIATGASVVVRGGQRHHTNHIGMRKSNHAVTSAALCDAFSRLWPERPEAEEFRTEAEEVWADWWLLPENLEIASNYEAFSQVELLAWAERRGQLGFALENTGTREWMDRALDSQLPSGVMPGYGDTCTMELWPDWLGLYAWIAVHTNSSRALDAAGRMFEWLEKADWMANVRLISDLPEDPYRARQLWTQIPRTAWYLSLACDMLRDRPESLRPEPPEARPVVTHRTIFAAPPEWDASWPLQPIEPGPRLPDKAVMKLGSCANSPTAMLACARQMWHDHIDSGSVLNFTSAETVLLDGPGYMQRYPIFHNLFWANDSDEIWPHYVHPETQHDPGLADDYTVKGMTGGAVAQVFLLENPSPHGAPMHHERLAVLSRRGIMVIRDMVTAKAPGLVGSPLWHQEEIVGHGAGWAIGRIHEFRGMNGPKMKNGPASLLITTPYETEQWHVHESENPDPYASPAYVDPVTRYFTFWKRSFVTRMCLSRPRDLLPGTPIEFLTVLLPAPDGKPDGAVLPLEVSDGKGRAFEAKETLLVLNEGIDAISGPWGSTDAGIAVLDDKGIMAHRMHNLAIGDLHHHLAGRCTRAFDLDLRLEDGKLKGAVSSWETVRVSVTWGGRTGGAGEFGASPASRPLSE